MNETKLFEALQNVDDRLLRQSEDSRPKLKKWGALAACLCLLTVAALTLPTLRPAAKPPAESTPDTNAPAPLMPVSPPDAPAPEVPADPLPGPDPSAEPAEPEWSPVYNDTTGTVRTDAAMIRYDPGAFTETLTEAELTVLLPEGEFLSPSGTACYSGQGELTRVVLEFSVPISLPDHRISVTLSPTALPRCYLFDAEPAATHCRGAEYTVYEFFHTGGVILEAEGTLGGVACILRMDAPTETEATARTQFEEALYRFARYAEAPPVLSAFTPVAIPEWFDRTLTHAQALSDETFGGLMPPATPQGFAAESIRRFKNQQNDWLSGLWTKDMDQLTWKVTFFTEADEARVTSVAETKNYDLSLYPIPRAESVPEELREIVNDPIFLAEELTLDAVQKRAYTAGEAGDSQGPRLNFSLRVGEYLISVRGKGVDPRWIFDALTQITGR